jgi:hypothetical protein
MPYGIDPAQGPEEEARLDFARLESLRLLCRQVRECHSESIRYFEYQDGFQHYKDKEPLKVSVSSSATCVLSLVAADLWKADSKKSKKLIRKLIPKNTSAGLPKNNAFTIAWILEAVTELERYADPLGPAELSQIKKMELMLQGAIRSGRGGVKIADYPPSAYLTQLVVRALDKRERLNKKLRTSVEGWAWAELTRQIALVQAKTKTADPFAVAYLLMLVSIATPVSKITPEQTITQRSALNSFFESQLDDGSWPLSRPLFHYRKFGNAYCYEFEMLTQLLQQNRLQDLLLQYLPRLRNAAVSALNSVYRLGEKIQVWTSGHHPQQGKPESWATASVYHFFYELDRLLAEAIRRRLFQYLDLPLSPQVPDDKKSAKKIFAPRFLDSRVKVRGSQRPLKRFLWENFVEPLARGAKRVETGDKFKKGTPISAIFFGPPGTSKTELATQIADFLGWPLLAIDPSHLLRNGMDGIQAEANEIFRMLEETERVVVLFDEFDEFVRERGSSDAEQFSRLLTTAMLPKLASIHTRATLVFIIATNNIRQFDLAIRRPGRFDRVVQIMPPIYDEKIDNDNWGASGNVNVGKTLKRLGVKIDGQVKKHLGDFTFLEFDAFATDLVKAKDAQEALRSLEYHWERCILQSVDEDNKTWKQRCTEEERFNR